MFASDLLYAVSTNLTKISILLFYRRLASRSISRSFQRLLHGTVIFVALTALVFTIVPFASCRPLNAFWNQVNFLWEATHKDDKAWTCYNEPMNYFWNGAISFIQDAMTCAMPMVLFWKLRMPLRQKFALGALFCVGFV